MVDSVEAIAEGLGGLAAVIRKHGTCAPAALDDLASRLRALSTPEASGADYVMVPREPTPEMLDEACKWVDGEFPEYAREVYRVMLAAAPINPAPPTSGVDWRGHYVEVTAMRYMDNGLHREAAMKAANREAASIEAMAGTMQTATPAGESGAEYAHGGRIMTLQECADAEPRAAAQEDVAIPLPELPPCDGRRVQAPQLDVPLPATPRPRNHEMEMTANTAQRVAVGQAAEVAASLRERAAKESEPFMAALLSTTASYVGCQQVLIDRLESKLAEQECAHLILKGSHDAALARAEAAERAREEAIAAGLRVSDAFKAMRSAKGWAATRAAGHECDDALTDLAAFLAANGGG